MNRKQILITLFAFVSIALVFLGCLPDDARLVFYSEKYDLFFATLPQNVYQSICYKFALPYTLAPGSFSIKGVLKTNQSLVAGQLATKLELIRKGHDFFSKDGMLDYDSRGRFHGNFTIDQSVDFNKNDIIKISVAPMTQSFSNTDEKFTMVYRKF